MSSVVLRFELVADMGGDPHEVLHEFRRVFKDGFVDLLVDVADAGATLVVGCGIGLVDMADFEGLGVEDFAVNLELLGDLLKFFFRVGHNSKVGYLSGPKNDSLSCGGQNPRA